MRIVVGTAYIKRISLRIVIPCFLSSALDRENNMYLSDKNRVGYPVS